MYHHHCENSWGKGLNSKFKKTNVHLSLLLTFSLSLPVLAKKKKNHITLDEGEEKKTLKEETFLFFFFFFKFFFIFADFGKGTDHYRGNRQSHSTTALP